MPGEFEALRNRRKERFVLPDGPADGKSKLVLTVLSFWNSSRILKEIRGIEGIIADEFPKIPMQCIRAGFNRRIQNSASRPSEFRTVVVRLYFELLYCVDRRRDGKCGAIQEVDEVGIVVDSVEEVIILSRTSPIGCKTATGAKPARVLLTLCYACCELREKGKVAAVRGRSLMARWATTCPTDASWVCKAGG